MHYLTGAVDLSVVDEFGAVVANLAATARKAITLGVSFLFFPKPFTAVHGVGVVIFFAGLVWNSQLRHKEKEEGKRKAKAEAEQHTPKKTQ